MSVSFTTGGDRVAAAACAEPAAGDGTPFDAWIADRRARVERALDRTLAPADSHPARLHEAMRYAALGGGKRIRALLVHAAGEALGAPAGALDCAAGAVELIHAYSLVHDDLPCMDNDVLRRGRPTVHVVYGEALAMLVGDALQALAFESLAAAADEGVDARTTVSMIAELARASGSVGMAGGQAIDLASVGVALPADALEDMHRRKTGALLAASVRLGGACGQRAGVSMPALARYADAVGLAFQIVDDILDVEGDSVTLGKTAGKDADADKPTYVSTLGLEAARTLAGRLRLQAHEAIAPLGPRAGRLAALADRIVLRRA